MEPITVSVEVAQPREIVYSYLDTLANHEAFTDHMMRHWRLQGPERGVGARAEVEMIVGGRRDPVTIEVIEATRPLRSVERNVGAGGKHVATGTYTLDELPNGGTRVSFEYAWLQMPLSERMAARLVRRVAQGALKTAMERLAQQLRDASEINR